MPDHHVTPRRAARRIADALKTVESTTVFASKSSILRLTERGRLLDSFIFKLKSQLRLLGWELVYSNEGFGLLNKAWYDATQKLLGDDYITPDELDVILAHDSPELN